MADIDFVTKSQQTRERTITVTLAPGQSLQDLVATDPNVAAFVNLAKQTAPTGMSVRVSGSIYAEVVS